MPLATAQFTITDHNDVNVQTLQPENPVLDTLWLDISLVPNELKRWDGQSWQKISDGDAASKDDLVNTTETFLSNITQEVDNIRREVSETFVSTSYFGQYTQSKSLQEQLTSDALILKFSTVEQLLESMEDQTQMHFSEIEKYIRFIDGEIHLGKNDSAVTLVIQNNRISFMENGSEVAHISNNTLNITDGSFFQTLNIGNFRFSPRSNGSLSFGKR